MIIHGNNILILNSGGTALIAASKSCDINVSVATQETSSPTTGVWKTHITKRKEWSVSLSHLVTMGQFPACLTAIGTSLTLKVGVRKPDGTEAPFNGIYAGEVSNNTTTSVSGVYWHGILKQFVGYVAAEEKYYKYWPQGEVYIFPSTDTPFTYDGKTYMWTPDEGLVKLTRLTGTATITDAKVTATRGNLAQGSWTLRGNGSLTMEDA